MTDPNASLASLIGSRLCHDLISPIGAIKNGLELLSLSGGGMHAPEMALIQESCDSAAARIRFFRVAFGSAGDAQLMSPNDVSATLAGIARGERLSGSWLAEGDQPRAAVQLAFLAYLCCEAALPVGGEVRITKDTRWRVTGTGPRISVQPDTWAMLDPGRTVAENVRELTPDRVQFALLRTLSEQREHPLEALTDSTRVQISFG